MLSRARRNCSLLACRQGCLLRAGNSLLRRHVLRRLLAAELAIFLAQALEIFEHFWRYAFGHALNVAANEGKVGTDQLSFLPGKESTDASGKVKVQSTGWRQTVNLNR